MPSPIQLTNPRRAHWRTALILLLAALLSVHFAMMVAKGTSLFLDTAAYTGFTAKRPFQYRLLMAPVLDALIHFHPVAAGLGPQLPAYLARPDQLAYAVINAAAFFIALLALWPLALRVHGGDRALAALSTALFVVLAYLFFCLNPNLAFALPYDIPALAFTLLSLLLYRHGWWAALFALFALATLNRETILFVPIAIAIRALLPGGNRRDLFGVAGLVLVWVAIKAALAIRFAHLPSEEGLRLGYNFAELAKPWQWPAIFVLPLLFALAARAAMRRDHACDLALAALVGGTILFAVGQLTETRAFGELIPYLALCLAPLVQGWLAPLSSPRHPH